MRESSSIMRALRASSTDSVIVIKTKSFAYLSVFRLEALEEPVPTYHAAEFAVSNDEYGL